MVRVARAIRVRGSVWPIAGTLLAAGSFSWLPYWAGMGSTVDLDNGEGLPPDDPSEKVTFAA